jgi:hypothetical protein
MSVIAGWSGKVLAHGPIQDFSPLDRGSFTRVVVIAYGDNFTIHDLGVPAQ